MKIEEYFERNGILQMKFDDISDEHRAVSRINDEKVYFEAYFRTGLDIVMERLDFELNKEMFPAVLREARKHQDLFEPMCQSGIFGCYIALETPGTYNGLDISPNGIVKAKQRAIANQLDPEIFTLGNLFEYDQQHEAIIGRYIMNDRYLNVSEKVLEALKNISKNIILIQPAHIGECIGDIEDYKEAVERQGLKFKLIKKCPGSTGTGSMQTFAFKASA